MRYALLKTFWGSRMKKIFYGKSNFGTILAGVFS